MESTKGRTSEKRRGSVFNIPIPSPSDRKDKKGQRDLSSCSTTRVNFGIGLFDVYRSCGWGLLGRVCVWSFPRNFGMEVTSDDMFTRLWHPGCRPWRHDVQDRCSEHMVTLLKAIGEGDPDKRTDVPDWGVECNGSTCLFELHKAVVPHKRCAIDVMYQLSILLIVGTCYAWGTTSRCIPRCAKG